MDEWFHYFVSARTIAAVKHLDFSPAGHQYRIDLPPVYKYIYGIPALLTTKFAPSDPSYGDVNLTYTRLASALMTSLTAVVILLFGWEFLSPFVGVVASLIFSFLPPIVAYAKVLSSDTPGVLLFSLSVYLFIKAMKKGGNNIFYLLTAISVGLTISSKYNNFLIFVLLVAILLLSQYKKIRKDGVFEVPFNLFLILPISIFIFFAIWPWLWTEPFSHLIQSFDHWVRQGSGFVSLNLQYFPVYFAITVPVVILFLFSIFFVLLIKDGRLEYWTLLFWFLVPFLVTFSKYKIDGIRFITSALVPVSLMAAVAIVSLSGLISQRIKKLPISVKGLLGFLVIVYLLVIDVKFHPYYLDYFNELIGGPRGAAARRVPVGFWGEGVKEAVDYVNKTAPQGSLVQFAVSQPNFIPKLRSDLVRAKPILPENLQLLNDPTTYQKELAGDNKLADFIVRYQVDVPNVEKYYSTFYQSKVLDYPLATVYRLNIQK